MHKGYRKRFRLRRGLAVFLALSWVGFRFYGLAGSSLPTPLPPSPSPSPSSVADSALRWLFRLSSWRSCKRECEACKRDLVSSFSSESVLLVYARLLIQRDRLLKKSLKAEAKAKLKTTISVIMNITSVNNVHTSLRPIRKLYTSACINILWLFTLAIKTKREPIGPRPQKPRQV